MRIGVPIGACNPMLCPIRAFRYWRDATTALASVSAFNQGTVGDQQRSWQATMTTGAMVYTSYPGPDLGADSNRLLQLLMAEHTGVGGGGSGSGAAPTESPSTVPDGGRSAGYWTGTASLPRIGQWRNVAVILYRPDPAQYAALQPVLFPFNYTHAAFPAELFDEVRQRKHCYIITLFGDIVRGLFLAC